MDDIAGRPISFASSTSGEKLLSAEVLHTIGETLEAYHDNLLSSGRLRWAARMVCATAHERNETIEHMIAALKPEWTTLLDASHFPRGASRTDVTNRFISLCIEQFYLGDTSGAEDEGTGGQIAGPLGLSLSSTPPAIHAQRAR